MTGGVVAGTALAADTDEPGLTASKTVTATDKPNVFDVNLSATGRDYAKNREHALFVLDRTGSVGQAEYDEIANAVRSLGRRLMATGQVQVSVVLFAGGAGEENSVWYDGYENMVTHSTNPADLDRIMVPVSTTTTTTHNGVFYGSEYGTNWEAAFDGASNVMAHEQLPTDVFFFSDGHPNTWAGADGYKEEEAYSRALSRAREFAASYGDHIQNFTSIGLQRDGQDLSKLEHLSKDVFGAKAKTEFSSTGDQVSEDLESNVENELMTGGFAKGVTLTDQLSGNVKPVSTDTKGRPGLSVGVSTDGGKATTLVEGKDYEYTYANNRISVRLLNQLKGSQTVTVTIPVKPTDKVLQQAVAGQPAPTREPGHRQRLSVKHGWYSNTGTNTVTHTSPNTGATGTSTLPKPVIPVQVARLQYDKNAETATGDMGKDAVTAPAGSEQAIAANKFANANYTFGAGTRPTARQDLPEGRQADPAGRHHRPVRAMEADPRIHPLRPERRHRHHRRQQGRPGRHHHPDTQRLLEGMLAVRLLEHPEGRQGHQIHRQAGCHPEGRHHPVRAVEARPRLQSRPRV